MMLRNILMASVMAFTMGAGLSTAHAGGSLVLTLPSHLDCRAARSASSACGGHGQRRQDDLAHVALHQIDQVVDVAGSPRGGDT